MMAPIKFEAELVRGDSVSGDLGMNVPLWVFSTGITMGQRVIIEMKPRPDEPKEVKP